MGLCMMLEWTDHGIVYDVKLDWPWDCEWWGWRSSTAQTTWPAGGAGEWRRDWRTYWAQALPSWPAPRTESSTGWRSRPGGGPWTTAGVIKKEETLITTFQPSNYFYRNITNHFDDFLLSFDCIFLDFFTLDWMNSLKTMIDNFRREIFYIVFLVFSLNFPFTLKIVSWFKNPLWIPNDKEDCKISEETHSFDGCESCSRGGEEEREREQEAEKEKIEVVAPVHGGGGVPGRGAAGRNINHYDDQKY